MNFKVPEYSLMADKPKKKSVKKLNNNSKCGMWEKNRRDRFNALIHTLASLLPDSSNEISHLSKAHIIIKAIEYIKWLRLSSTACKECKKNRRFIKIMKKRVSKLRRIVHKSLYPKLSSADFRLLSIEKLYPLINDQDQHGALKENPVCSIASSDFSQDVFVAQIREDHSYALIEQNEANVEIIADNTFSHQLTTEELGWLRPDASSNILIETAWQPFSIMDGKKKLPIPRLPHKHCNKPMKKPRKLKKNNSLNPSLDAKGSSGTMLNGIIAEDENVHKIEVINDTTTNRTSVKPVVDPSKVTATATACVLEETNSKPHVLVLPHSKRKSNSSYSIAALCQISVNICDQHSPGAISLNSIGTTSPPPPTPPIENFIEGTDLSRKIIQELEPVRDEPKPKQSRKRSRRTKLHSTCVHEPSDLLSISSDSATDLRNPFDGSWLEICKPPPDLSVFEFTDSVLDDQCEQPISRRKKYSSNLTEDQLGICPPSLKQGNNRVQNCPSNDFLNPTHRSSSDKNIYFDSNLKTSTDWPTSTYNRSILTLSDVPNLIYPPTDLVDMPSVLQVEEVKAPGSALSSQPLYCNDPSQTNISVLKTTGRMLETPSNYIYTQSNSKEIQSANMLITQANLFSVNQLVNCEKTTDNKVKNYSPINKVQHTKGSINTSNYMATSLLSDFSAIENTTPYTKSDYPWSCDFPSFTSHDLNNIDFSMLCPASTSNGFTFCNNSLPFESSIAITSNSTSSPSKTYAPSTKTNLKPPSSENTVSCANLFDNLYFPIIGEDSTCYNHTPATTKPRDGSHFPLIASGGSTLVNFNLSSILNFPPVEAHSISTPSLSIYNCTQNNYGTSSSLPPFSSSDYCQFVPDIMSASSNIVTPMLIEENEQAQSH